LANRQRSRRITFASATELAVLCGFPQQNSHSSIRLATWT
jgi:hypothetical protein